MKLPTPPIGRSMKTNVAVQPSANVNIKESENLAEQAAAKAGTIKSIEPQPTRFYRHGTFGPEIPHAIERLWSD